MTDELAIRSAQPSGFVLSMNTPLSCRNSETDGDFIESLQELDDAIQTRRMRTSGPAAVVAEQEVCIEVRSVVVAYKDLTTSCGFDEQWALEVQQKLSDALGVLSVEPQCVYSVRYRLENEFQSFVSKMRPSSLTASSSGPRIPASELAAFVDE